MVYVIVGASASGINAAKTLRENDKNAEIILVSKDEYVYSRCILHHFLDGRREIEALPSIIELQTNGMLIDEREVRNFIGIVDAERQELADRLKKQLTCDNLNSSIQLLEALKQLGVPI